VSEVPKRQTRLRLQFQCRNPPKTPGIGGLTEVLSVRKVIVALAAVLTLGVAVPEAAQARPGGCLKYGVGGAIAGHSAGGHRWKGAAAGCALGIYQRRRAERLVRERANERDRTTRPDRLERRERLEPDATGSLPRGASSDGQTGPRPRRLDQRRVVVVPVVSRLRRPRRPASPTRPSSQFSAKIRFPEANRWGARMSRNCRQSEFLRHAEALERWAESRVA
jgi:hypothetical protein